ILPGVHGLSNRLLDEPWPKVQRGVAVLTGLLESSEADLTEALLALLRDRTAAPDHLLPSTGIALERERALSPAFIAGDTYGTRASTVLLVNKDGDVLFCERTFGPHGTPLRSTDRRFKLSKA
ncbi:MAG: NRDE family protein, partial [Burkholderiales bacterium]